MKKKNVLTTALAIIGFATISIAQIVPSYVPTSGLVGWWPFTGNANDMTGNVNNGTVNGATLTNDRFGNANSAYYFNNNSEIRIFNSSSLANFTDKYTISAWVDISDFNSVGLFPIIDKNQLCAPTSGTTPFLFVGSNDATNGYHIQNIDCGVQTQLGRANEVSTLNTWTHVVAVYNGIDIKIYVNDILKFTNPATGNISASTGDLTIGRCTFGFGHYAIGNIDDIGIWNSALTQCEVSDLYHSQLGYSNTSSTQTQTALDNYTWPVNGQIYTQSGTYTEVIPNVAGCDSTITLDLSLDFTGLVENSQDALFSVFPNPAQSAINIKADNKLIGDIYTIYDNTGRVVLTGKLNSKDTTIELNNLTGGIYMFSVGENMKQTFKVIKE